MIDDEQSITGVHHFPSRRMALAERAERIADMLERLTSSVPPPPEDEPPPEPVSEPPPLAA